MNKLNEENSIRDKVIAFTVIIIAAIALIFINSNKVHAIQDWDGEYFSYGAGLSKAQLKETERIVGIPNDKNIQRVIVNSQDYHKYTGLTTKDSSLYSSVVIIKTKKGSGVNVYINTPDNITKIEDHQYLNAALTSGLKDSNIVVGSPVKVSGESALVGVYKALDEAGVAVDEEATKVATEELSVVSEISEENAGKDNFDSEEFSLAMAEIKEKIAEIADKDSLTAEEINVIVNNVLDKRNLSISEADKEKISTWASKFKSLDIDWKSVGKELKNIGGKVAGKAEEVYEWGKESGFFARIWESIVAFFTTLFK